ncbi:MAG: retropepsin-like aspartic protease [Candidatus Thorarchaeota archaeon]
MEIEVKPEINMGHVNIPVSVNGQGPFSFVLDTGASITTIGKRLAEKLGIETRAGSRTEARGVGGGIPVQYADVEIGMGSLEFEKDEVYVLDFETIFRGLGSRDGAFGFTTLKYCTMSISYTKESFKLHKGKSERDLDWIPFEYVKNSHLIELPVHINGEGPYNFALDTGAGGTVMDPVLAEKLGLDVQAIQGIARGLGGDMQLKMAKAESLSVGDGKITNNQIVVMDSSKVSPKGKLIENGIIGYDFLKNFETVIDYPSKQISFIDERH